MTNQVLLYATGENAVAIDKAIKSGPEGLDGMTDEAVEARKICFGLIEQLCGLLGLEYDSVGIAEVIADIYKGNLRYRITGLVYKEE